MARDSILFVHKRSALEMYRTESADHLEAHRRHVSAMARIQRLVDRWGAPSGLVLRSQLTTERAARADLVVSVGGDGTFLEAAGHLVGPAAGTPLVGLNSDRRPDGQGGSEGYLCLLDIDDLEESLDRVRDGEGDLVQLGRLSVSIDDSPLPVAPLNEVYIGSPRAYTVSRYRITVRGVTEEQRSSGVLVAPATGCTGWIKNAGGVVLDLSSRQHQYRIREPIQGRAVSAHLLGGVLEPSESVQVEIMAGPAVAAVDGGHGLWHVRHGSRVEVRGDGPPLVALRPPGRDWPPRSP